LRGPWFVDVHSHVDGTMAPDSVLAIRGTSSHCYNCREMTVGILKETFPGERRVAVIPAGVATLKKAGIAVVVEPGAGTSAGFPD